ncbi:hypothetical protein BH20BAC1_BH20BAC1_21750 [soil metagenome]
MIHKTNGIVLRTVKYGETSVIAKIFTELFGIQSYIVNGVRTRSKTSKAHYFQPSCILDLEVYHSDLKNLQRIKEMRWSYLYQYVLNDVIKNSVALFIVELLYKCLKEPEQNILLFEFCENTLVALDKQGHDVAANLPLYFSVQLPNFFGFRLQDNYSISQNLFDPVEGKFTNENEEGQRQIKEDVAYYISLLIKIKNPGEVNAIKLNRLQRRTIFAEMMLFYNHHFPDFGAMNTLAMMQEIL